MGRWKFIIGVNLIILFLGVLVIGLVMMFPRNIRAQTSSCETRGVWLNAGDWRVDRRAGIVDKVRRANLNTVFLIAPRIGNNNGWGDANDFFNAIADFKNIGVGVHLWLVNAFRTSNGNPTNECTDQVDYRQPAELAAQVQWVKDLLAKYANPNDSYPDVDGVHFDYIRYINWTSQGQYCAEHQFKDKIDAVSQVVQSSFQAIKQQYPDKMLTAAVFAVDPQQDNPATYLPAWFVNWRNQHPGNIYPYHGGNFGMR